MLAKKIESALNEQIAKEAYASNYYLAMASWAEEEGLRGISAFLYDQAREETEHMMKILRYVNASGGHGLVSAVKEPPNEFKSITEVFQIALEHELSVTKSISKIVDTALTEKDYATFNFLQWFVSEQHEEEHLFTSILDLIKITGTDQKGVFFADNEINKLREAESKEK